jgi:hypothetical protein
MPDLTAVLVVGTIFGFTAIIVVVSMYARHRARQMRHETIRLALEKGQPLPPEALGSLGSPQQDLTRGVRLVALGIGLSAFLYLLAPSHGNLHGHNIWAVGLILVAIGVGHLVSYFLTRGRPPPPERGPAR